MVAESRRHEAVQVEPVRNVQLEPLLQILLTKKLPVSNTVRTRISLMKLLFNHVTCGQSRSEIWSRHCLVDLYATLTFAYSTQRVCRGG